PRPGGRGGMAPPARPFAAGAARPRRAGVAQHAHQAGPAEDGCARGRECRGGSVGGAPAMSPDQVGAEAHAEAARGVLEQLARVVLGQAAAIREAFLALLARGHVLLEGPPGTAKTLLVRAMNQALGLEFRRIQFTPDLMPSDITGINLLGGSGEFVFRAGPIFADLVLADEINRAPAKTQAALLEAMQERSVTVDGTAHRLPATFTVFATQNPIEFEGTYPLPE